MDEPKYVVCPKCKDGYLYGLHMFNGGWDMKCYQCDAVTWISSESEPKEREPEFAEGDTPVWRPPEGWTTKTPTKAGLYYFRDKYSDDYEGEAAWLISVTEATDPRFGQFSASRANIPITDATRLPESVVMNTIIGSRLCGIMIGSYPGDGWAPVEKWLGRWWGPLPIPPASEEPKPREHRQYTWVDASIPPSRTGDNWSRTVVGMTNLGKLCQVAHCGEWQRLSSFVDGEHIVAWIDAPELPR